MNAISVRIFFGSLDVAIEALLLILEDARETDKKYFFGSTSAQQILASGLMLIGDAQHLVDMITELSDVSVTSD